jgi:multiple sugar transport system permease protein
VAFALLMAALFSIKPDSDFTQGNLLGLPTSFAGFENYARVFTDSAMPRYLMNSVFITVPTVIGAVALSCMTGFALGVYRFRAISGSSSCSWPAISCPSRY